MLLRNDLACPLTGGSISYSANSCMHLHTTRSRFGFELTNTESVSGGLFAIYLENLKCRRLVLTLWFA